MPTAEGWSCSCGVLIAGQTGSAFISRISAQVLSVPGAQHDGAASMTSPSVLNVASPPFVALSLSGGWPSRRLRQRRHAPQELVADLSATATGPLATDLADTLRPCPIPADGLALSWWRAAFKGSASARWKAFANRARLPEPAVLKVCAGHTSMQPFLNRVTRATGSLR